jgi:hypothetical protein
MRTTMLRRLVAAWSVKDEDKRLAEKNLRVDHTMRCEVIRGRAAALRYPTYVPSDADWSLEPDELKF